MGTNQPELMDSQSTQVETPSNNDLAAAQPQEQPKVSFRLSLQKKEKVVIGSAGTLLSQSETIELEEESEGQKRSVVSLENGTFKDAEGSVNLKKEKKIFVIEARKPTNDWRIAGLKKMVEEGVATEEDKARLALMIEALGIDDGGGLPPKTYGNADSKVLELPTTIEEAEDADYDEIPIGEFGLAFLRGCGWKEEEGIGKTNRQTVKMQLSKPRPKGLGLGADMSKFKQPKDANDPSTLKRNSKVRILCGADRDCVGQVLSLDEDNSSCFVEMAINGRVIKISQFNVEVLVTLNSHNNKGMESRDTDNRADRERERKRERERNGDRRDVGSGRTERRRDTSRERYESKRSRRH